MTYRPTPEDIEFAEQQVTEDPTNLDRAAQLAETWINAPGRAITGGIMQGAERGGASIANLPLSLINKLMGTKLEVPYVDIEEKVAPDPLMRALFKGGEIAGELVPGLGAYGKVAQVLGKPSLLKNILGGAATGFAVGGAPEDDLTNRFLTSLVGGAIPAVGGVAKKSIANRVVAHKKGLQDFFKTEYGKVFGKLKEANLHDKKIEIPKGLNIFEKKGASKILGPGSAEHIKGVQKFLENPTFKNAHTAQSDLRKISKKLTHQFSRAKETGVELPSVKRTYLSKADELRKSIQSEMDHFLTKNSRPDILASYKNVSKEYKDKLVPYFHPTIAKYEKKAVRPKKLLQELMKSEEFVAPKGPYKDIPGFGTRRALHESGLEDALTKALQGAALGAGAAGGAAIGFPYAQRALQR